MKSIRETWALALVLLVAVDARAADTWTRPYGGVRQLHRTTSNPSQDIHALEVTLTTPGITLRSTASTERRRTVSSFASLVGAELAINGDFFSYETYSTSGLSAGSGAQWAGTADNSSNGTLAFGAGRVELSAPSQVVTFDASWMRGVVSGHPGLVRNGTVNTFSASSSLCNTRHPRTALGMSEDGSKLWMVVVDGRRTGAAGMTCAELATLMKGLGAHHALNLDGGGSSAMYVKGQGVVNRPSDGNERTVANHLAVNIGPAPQTGVLKGVIYRGSDTADRVSGATVRVTGGPNATTGTTGLYEFDLAPGEYTVTASKTGFRTASVTRTVTAGMTTWGSISLVPNPPPAVDAGPAPVVDAGAPTAVDAGPPDVVDAGSPEADAGSEPGVEDAGSEPIREDAGSEPVIEDAGIEPVIDAGSAPVIEDAGMEPMVEDAGTIPAGEDAGGATVVDDEGSGHGNAEGDDGGAEEDAAPGAGCTSAGTGTVAWVAVAWLVRRRRVSVHPDARM